MSLFLKNAESNKKNIYLKPSENISKHMNDVLDNVDSLRSKYTSSIINYKKVVKFNKTLSDSYESNLVVLIDMSKLLTQYATFLKHLSTVIAEASEEIDGVTFEDLKHMQALAGQQASDIMQIFKENTYNLMQVYSEYNDKERVDTLKNLIEKADIVSDFSNQLLKGIAV